LDSCDKMDFFCKMVLDSGHFFWDATQCPGVLTLTKGCGYWARLLNHRWKASSLQVKTRKKFPRHELVCIIQQKPFGVPFQPKVYPVNSHMAFFPFPSQSYHSSVLFISWNAFINGFPLDFPWISLHFASNWTEECHDILKEYKTAAGSKGSYGHQMVAEFTSKPWLGMFILYTIHVYIFICIYIYILCVYSCKHVYTQIWYTKPKYSKP
jgi:hypothetical protein